MSDTPDLPVFPFEPTKLRTARFRTSQYGDFPCEEEVQRLIRLLWLEPECTVYYYFEKDGSIDAALENARVRGDILMDDMERRFYAHPKFERDYVLIPDRGDEYSCAWEREAVEKGPEYWQVHLRLSSRKSAELDAWRKVHLEDAYREELRRSKYAYDVFLSYAEANRTEADLLHDKVVAAGGKIFMAPKILAPGDDFAEEIRAALENARELWLLVSSTSVESEWVISEWGAAWVLRKRIVPILHRCAPDVLPDRLKRLHVIDFYKADDLVAQSSFASRADG